ncbi:MAG: transcription termination factor Rho [Chthoniobacterales bacterium]|jgi:transcription termination factor Rho
MKTMLAPQPETGPTELSVFPPNAAAVAGFEASVDDLQRLNHVGLTSLLDRYQLRPRPDATKRHLVFDLCRFLVAAGAKLTVAGIIETMADHAMLRWARYNFAAGPDDLFVSIGLVRDFNLQSGLRVRGTLRLPADRERYCALVDLTTIEEIPVAEWKSPTPFDKLTPLFPQERIMLESLTEPTLSARAVDLIAPLGKGQRALIVAPPRTGKTILMKHLAQAIRSTAPDVRLMLLLVDERPEEVTDLRRSIDADIYSSTFDESPQRHTELAELVSERAKRLVELGQDVVILLDSITRLARGYNNLQPGKGRIMSGGVDAKALMKPKRFFGAARNTEEGGSLTIVATALVETQSRMDDLIFEEFKGTGNMEVHLDRTIADQRIFPAIHVTKSATRREENLYHPDELARVIVLRKQLNELPAVEAMETLMANLNRTQSNAELLLRGLR